MIETRTRANVLFTLHLILLTLSNRLSFVANLLDLSLYTFYVFHDFIDFIIIVQALIYVLIFVLHNALRLRDSFHFYDFLMRWIFFDHTLIDTTLSEHSHVLSFAFYMNSLISLRIFSQVTFLVSCTYNDRALTSLNDQV